MSISSWVLLLQKKWRPEPIWWYLIFWMYLSPSCSPRFASLSAAVGSLDQADRPSKGSEQGCKRATKEGSSVHPSLRRLGLVYRARTCGFPSQKLFPVACSVLRGHGCRWKRREFWSGTPSRWPPWAKHLEGKLCWSCGGLPTHTWWSNTPSLAFMDACDYVDPDKNHPHLSSLPLKRRSPFCFPLATRPQV